MGTTALTPRELEVARLIAEGYSDKEIVNHVGLSVGRIRQIIDRLARVWRLDYSRNLRTQITRHVVANGP